MSQVRAYGRPPSPTPTQVNWWGLIQVGAVMMVAYVVWQVHHVYVNRQEQWTAVEQWMGAHGLTEFTDQLQTAGIYSMNDVAVFSLPLEEHGNFKTLSPKVYAKLQRAIQMYQDESLLKLWLEDHSLMKYADRMLSENVRSLDKLAHISEIKLQKIVGIKARISEYKKVQQSLQELHTISPNFSQYKSNKNSFFTRGTLVSTVLCFVFLASIVVFRNLNSAYILFQSQQRHKRSLFDFVTGQYLAPQGCRVDWEWKDKLPVGQTLHFNIWIFQWNGASYPVSNSDNVLIEIHQGTTLLTSTVQLAGEDPEHSNRIRVTFTVHRSGSYRISVLLSGKHINGSPFEKTFLPGPIDPLKTQFVNQGVVVVGSTGRSLHLTIEPRDSFDNLCEFTSSQFLKDDFQMVMTESSNQVALEPSILYTYLDKPKHIQLSMNIDQLGCYHTLVTYKDKALKNSEFHIIILNERELASVEKAVSRRSHNISYDARLLSTNYHSPSDKGKKIFCYVSPKQLTIKEFHFKIIPKKLNTFRVCPSTKFQFLGIHNQLDLPILSIEDGCQPPVLLASKDRNIMAAAFSKFLMKNIGGSETFKDKQDFFYHEVRQLHSKKKKVPTATLR